MMETIEVKSYSEMAGISVKARYKVPRRNSFLLLFLLLLAGVSTIRAQIATTGIISGTVTDPAGAFVPQATITLTDLDTGAVTTTVSNKDGIFSQVGLQPDTYRMQVSKEGFATVNESGIILDPASIYTVNVTLKLGGSSTTVTVTAAPEQVQLSTPEISNTVTEVEVRDLPLNGRNFEQLASLMPGVVNTSEGSSLGTGGYTTDNVMSVNGGAVTTPSGQGSAPNAAIHFVDGIWNSASVEHDQTIILPNPDAISELKVMQNNYSAQYRLMGAGVVMVETKSGTSMYHGDLWEYLRNTAFDATPYLTTSPSVLHWNIYGWDLGGPLAIPGVSGAKLDKTFFYFNQQWVHQTTGGVAVGTTPSAAMRGIGTPNNEALIPMIGIFAPGCSASTTPATCMGYLKDPTLSGNCNATSSTACFGTDGAGNWVIPSNRIDQNGLRLLNALANLPNNLNGAVGGFDNYINTAPTLTTQMDIIGKLDYSLTNRLQLMGEYLQEEQKFTGANAARMGSPFSTNYDVFETDNQSGQVRLTQILSPSMLNQTSVATSVFDVTHDYGGTHLISQVSGFNQDLPYTGGYLQTYLPSVSFSNNWSKFGTGAAYIVPRATEVHTTIADDWSWQLGKHFLRAGGIMLFGIERHSGTNGATMGQWDFNGSYTNSPIGDYLLGEAVTFEQTNTGTRTAMRYTIFSPYVEDQWKVLPRLTVTGGLRWFRMPWPTEPTASISAFDPASFNPANAPIVATNGTITPTPNYSETNGIVLNGVNGVPLNLTDAHKYYFSPMAGFALDLFGNGKTSLRGGYAITHNESAGQGCAEQGCLGYPVVQEVNLTKADFTDPFNGATTSASTVQSIFGQTLTGYKPATIQTYSLSLQQELGMSWWMSIAGAGDNTKGLLDPNINQPGPVPGYDFNPALNTNTNPGYYAPYQGYLNIGYYENVERSRWNALEVAVRHRAATGLYLTLAYTWSHNLDNAGGFQNNLVPMSAYGNSTLNVPNVFALSVIYAIPTPRTFNTWERAVLAGWRFADMTTFQSGKSLSLGLSNGDRGIATRPNLVANLTYPKQLAEWFSTTSYVPPSHGFFGTVGNGTLYGPGLELFNMAMYKDFQLPSRFVLEFRAEYFNVFNHLNPGNPNTSIGGGGVGQITSARNPREGEFALRLKF